MLEGTGDILNTECDVFFVTTNGYVKKNGSCVMGRGIAKQVSYLDENIPYILGELITKKGNNVHFLKTINNKDIYSFPVKPISAISDGTNSVSGMKFNIGSEIPGWACKAELEIISKSVDQVIELFKNSNKKTILLPRPGCGCGELSWDLVKPIMEKLDDRFICMTFN